MIFQNCLKFQLPKKARREITYNNFEKSLVVLISNITTNHAITYTNSNTAYVTYCDGQLLQIITAFYYKMRQGLLRDRTLQSAMYLLHLSTLTKCDQLWDITTVNSASSEILMILLWLYGSILEWFYLTRERDSSIVKCETAVQLGKSDVAYQTEMLEGKTPMSHCETLTSHRKQQCWIIKLKCRHGQQQFWITKLKCRMAKNRVKS